MRNIEEIMELAATVAALNSKKSEKILKIKKEKRIIYSPKQGNDF